MSYHSNISIFGGAPVVALHSSASSSAQWAALESDVSDRQDFVALDLPGYGSSGQRVSGSMDMTAIAGPMIDAIRPLGGPVHLVGHSMGGGVALKIALTHPQLVRSLTLYEPVAFQLINPIRSADQELLAPLRDIQAKLARESEFSGSSDGMAAFIDFWNGQGSWNSLSGRQKAKIAADRDLVLSDINHSMNERWTADMLQAIDQPTQIIMGMDSPALAQRMSTVVYENINQSELVMLPGLGHMAPMVAPDWVNPRIQQHIARAERGADGFSWPRRVAT